MPLKKSALLLIALSVGSVGLLVFSSDITMVDPIAEPAKCKPSRSCSQLNEMKSFAPWDMVSQIMLRSAA